MHRFLLIGLTAALASCQAAVPAPVKLAPIESIVHLGPKATGSPVAVRVSTLAHEGGIVFALPPEQFTDPSRQAAATVLGTELDLDLRARRAMEDAELLASQPQRGFELLALPAAAPDEDPAARTAATQAESAWQRLSTGERERAEAAHDARTGAQRDRLADALPRRTAGLVREPSDALSTRPDGGKSLGTVFRATDRTVAVSRRYDASGTLVQTFVTLAAANMDGRRTRTLLPDGRTQIAVDTRLTIAGQAHAIHWEQQIAADGTLAATGTISRPDGSRVGLTGTGSAAGPEVVAGHEPDRGVRVALEADAAGTTATATVDAGDAGQAVVQLDADDDAH